MHLSSPFSMTIGSKYLIADFQIDKFSNSSRDTADDGDIDDLKNNNNMSWQHSTTMRASS